MMKVAFITRSTLHTVPGGDTVQVMQTAKHLAGLGLQVDIKLANEVIAYQEYDLLHFFNIIRPADILYHSQKARKPFVVSTILCDYSEYDKHQAKGIRALLGLLPGNIIEYVKTIARWLLGKDHLSSISYLWLGQRKSIQKILREATLVLPNSVSEYERLIKAYKHRPQYQVIPNGVNPGLFHNDGLSGKDDNLVLCVARIEGIKNQQNLIKALNHTRFTLLVIGAHAPNHAAYYRECLAMAAGNVRFISHMPQAELVDYYRRARVHVLPSWFETTGLSSVEAAAMGCNIVISDKGDTREYFGNDAFYCNPAEPQSILAAVEKASKAAFTEGLRQRILKQFTWQQAAIQTYKAYQIAQPA
ncbi:glycosyltransferase family 4 protein [Mucilaginibacter psychrotolerans]|uniref:Glycosyltransferase n=1 Tax=Mucilaginibacter psychrotolerans TaxID=1524096 RepID=A0A4Y8SGZ8_9SPHI|nr:glycosyltransferase family 4 protein [Mucilaginibacter psychrotolerans]TFF38208.1 glycosyltransferase [Mucilaginibacter psychrotolerans]